MFVINYNGLIMFLCIPSFPFTQIKSCTTNSGKRVTGLPFFIKIKFMENISCHFHCNDFLKMDNSQRDQSLKADSKLLCIVLS